MIEHLFTEKVEPDAIAPLTWWMSRLGCASVKELLGLCRAQGIPVVEFSKKRRCLMAKHVLAVAEKRLVHLGERTVIAARTENGQFIPVGGRAA